MEPDSPNRRAHSHHPPLRLILAWFPLAPRFKRAIDVTANGATKRSIGILIAVVQLGFVEINGLNGATCALADNVDQS